MAEIKFLDSHVKYDTIKHVAAFCRHFVLFSPKGADKHPFLF